MKIAFHTNQINERGTTIAVYDYAKYNHDILGNDSVIVSSGTDHRNYKPAIEQISSEFPLHFYKDFSETDEILEKEKIDMIYFIKAGKRDGKLSKVCKNAVHCVFDGSQPHGDACACVSDWLGKKYRLPAVPHIVHKLTASRNLREELGIPKDAFVFGRHGGVETFNIDYAHQVIHRVAKVRKDAYFLFLNTHKFCDHERVIHLPKTSNMDEKTAFIATCDAYLHCRTQGETFGLAIAEFSVMNKPAITCKGKDNAHLDMLGDKAIIYRNEEKLQSILLDIKKVDVEDKDWDAYSKPYSPQEVMKRFKKVFIDGVATSK